MNYVLYEMIYTKGLTTTQMCFHETNVSSESMKEHRNQTTNASQTQSNIKPPINRLDHTLKTKSK
jgi:hypothetical protein